jgi:predicted RNA binding protein YcfA (HicA-like mRNA interferase family)
MTKLEKLLKRIENNPKAVTMADLQTLLEAYGFRLARVKGSHYIFEHAGRDETLVIPYRRPYIKASYVKDALARVENIADQED